MKWRTLFAVLFAAVFVAMPASAQLRDGAHDFDQEIGRWRIETRRLMHPLAESNDWTTYEGEKIVTPIWGGRGNLAEVREGGEAGQLHFAALRLYDPETRQWGLYFTSASDGAFSVPLYGELRDGAMEFVGPDTFQGRAILVRFLTRGIDRDHARSEQYFSADGGRTWELNWVNEYTRLGDAPAAAAPPAQSSSESGVHDFDFALGTFHTSIRRLERPLTGSNSWVTYEGTKRDV